jgi:hypothetical protein
MGAILNNSHLKDTDLKECSIFNETYGVNKRIINLSIIKIFKILAQLI